MLPEKTLYIKGMVCNRCIQAIRTALSTIGVNAEKISLGRVTLAGKFGQHDKQLIETRITALGFEFIDDKNLLVTDEVKKLVAEVYSGDYNFPYNFRFSSLVKERLLKDYDAVSRTFSDLEGSTLENYIINYRIDKAKEYLINTSASLSDISFLLGYSSVAHLSRQFKSIAGINTSFYRNENSRKERISTI